MHFLLGFGLFSGANLLLVLGREKNDFGRPPHLCLNRGGGNDITFQLPSSMKFTPPKSNIDKKNDKNVGFKYVLFFIPKIGECEPILTIIFFKWVAQPPTSN